MKFIVFILNAAVISVLLIWGKSFPPEIPIYHAEPWGESRLGDKWSLLIVLALFNISYFVSSAIQKRLFPGDDYVRGAILICQVSVMAVMAVCYLRLMLILI